MTKNQHLVFFIFTSFQAREMAPLCIDRPDDAQTQVDVQAPAHR